MSQITCSFTRALGGRTEIGNALYLLVAGVTSRLTIATPPPPPLLTVKKVWYLFVDVIQSFKNLTF